MSEAEEQHPEQILHSSFPPVRIVLLSLLVTNNSQADFFTYIRIHTLLTNSLNILIHTCTHATAEAEKAAGVCKVSSSLEVS